MNKSRVGIQKSITAAAALLAALCSFSSVAAQTTLTGQVYNLITMDPNTSASVEGGSKFRLSIPNVQTQSAGTCFKDGSGYVVIWVKDNAEGERMFTTLLAAHLSATTVSVIVDDTYVNEVPPTNVTICYAKQIKIGM